MAYDKLSYYWKANSHIATDSTVIYIDETETLLPPLYNSSLSPTENNILKLSIMYFLTTMAVSFSVAILWFSSIAAMFFILI